MRSNKQTKDSPFHPQLVYIGALQLPPAGGDGLGGAGVGAGVGGCPAH